MSAISTAARVAAGTLTAAHVLNATLARIDAEDGALGAFTARLDATTALGQLKQMQLDGNWGPLQGLAVAVKDNIDTADLPDRKSVV